MGKDGSIKMGQDAKKKDREERLAQQLRANLLKRKEKMRQKQTASKNMYKDDFLSLSEEEK